MDIRVSNHSTVAIQELMHTVGVLDPKHAGTKEAVRQIGVTIMDMKPHRVFAPDPDVLGRAALLSGMLCRLQGYEKMRACGHFTIAFSFCRLIKWVLRSLQPMSATLITFCS